MKVMLTSAGLETESLKDEFIKLLPRIRKETKALFIPTAAINADAISVLSECINDLIKCAIKKENITIYDLHRPMSFDEVRSFDVIYICGGDPRYLLERINEQGFNKVLLEYVRNNGILFGVSAGSIIAAQNLENNLGIINCYLSVHCEKGDTAGLANLSNCPRICLTNEQAISITKLGCASIIE
ncbi:MAG: Type 1 glutamine amidotransferase-like domain-containing protein [Clostridia bacterium]|nr:Type 1 glutamine amidotransferase-like domain-containing protein [Clostridia bacterium]